MMTKKRVRKLDDVQRLIRILEEAAKPEAPVSAPFGKFLFGQERGFGEPNTEAEDRLKIALRAFISDESDPRSLSQFAPKILELLKKHQYLPLLDPGTARVYRGIALTIGEVKALLEPYGMELQRGTTEGVVCNLPGQLHPLGHRKSLASWSLSHNVAAGFAITAYHEADYGDDDEVPVPVVFAARPNAEGNAFFGKPGEIAGPVGLNDDFIDEQETISFGPVEHDGFCYILPENGQFSVAMALAAAAIKIH